jgi:tripartite ATP-independent transporter DctP family solute receptor
MKRILFISFVCVLGVGLLFVGTQRKAVAKTYTFKFAHSQPLTSPRHRSMIFFKDILEKASGDRIKVELFGGGVLGTESEVMDMVKVGNLQGTRGGLFAKANKKFLFYTLPFLFDDTDQVLKVMRSPFADKIAEGAKVNGFYIPATGVAGGFRQFTNNKRPIETPADMKGLKMRTPPIDSIIRTMKAIGASPQQVPYKETYMALKTGVVDGEENPASNITEMKFYEVQKYFTIVNYQVHPDPFFVTLGWYNSLPADLKDIFYGVARAAIMYSDTIWLSSEQDYVNFLKTKMAVNEISPSNRKLFIDKVKSVWTYYINEGVATQAEIDEALAIAAGK